MTKNIVVHGEPVFGGFGLKSCFGRRFEKSIVQEGGFRFMGKSGVVNRI
jgi:hypothetical protein